MKRREFLSALAAAGFFAGPTIQRIVAQDDREAAPIISSIRRWRKRAPG